MATHNPAERSSAGGIPKAKRREGFTVTLQTEWFERNKGESITVRLMDGTWLSGVLEGWDTDTVALRMAGREETVLVCTHGVALFQRVDPIDEEQSP